MTDLQWTDEPPEEEGYFWYSERSFGPKVCHFSPDGIGGGHAKFNMGSPYALHELHGKWAPIPRPSDPHQNE